jgi:hypothetical protein
MVVTNNTARTSVYVCMLCVHYFSGTFSLESSRMCRGVRFTDNVVNV